MLNPTAAILIIGDEILSGRTRDSNMHYLSCELTKIGIDLQEARFIPDNAAKIIDDVRCLSSKYDYVFTSGGIGPTHDDITADCIAAVKPGKTFGDIGHAIQTYVEANRMSVVRDFCGHGLGRVFHSPPNVLHYGREGTGPRIEEGMFFTIEPMVNLGRPETKVLSDEWTAVTRDKSLSAQFEHAIGVTKDGAEIFTLSPENKFHPTYD